MTDFTHHHLSAEQFSDKEGMAIMLTQQEGIDEPDTIVVHPWQLRAVCEQFGLITSDPQAAKTIATLQRRMVLLRDRIDRLHNYLVNHSDHKHADLSYEVTYATACIDLADEFCADFENEESEQAAHRASLGNSQVTTPAECSPAPAAQAELL